jgi:hypothetical protein
MSEDRDPDLAVQAAAEWLATTDPSATGIHRPVVPCLRERFGLNASDAIEAVRRANVLRNARAA